MTDTYRYTDKHDTTIGIGVTDDGHDAIVWVRDSRLEGARVRIPADERRAAARALAGPNCRVVPRDLTVEDLQQIARDAGVKLDMDLQVPESEPLDSETVDQGRTVNVAWHDDVEGSPCQILADADHGITASSSEDGTTVARVPLPERPQTRLDLARLIAPDGWTIVPSESATNAAAMQEDLRAILDALGLGDHARPYSPHECVTRDVLPAIQRLQQTASMPTWERQLLAGQAAQEEIDTLKRDYDALEKRLREAEAQPDRPEPVDPASVRVGDVVEIEGDDWMVRARVADTDDPSHDGPPYPQDSPFGIKLDRFYWWPKIADATVRILHRPEPEIDAAQVEALLAMMRQAAAERRTVAEAAEVLIRRGVTVPEVDHA